MAYQYSESRSKRARAQRESHRLAIRAAITSALETHRAVGVVHIDIDRFHLVNTRFGRKVGDEILDSLGSRLITAVTLGSVFAETDGDAFLVVLPGSNEVQTVELTRMMLGIIAEPFDVNGGRITLDASAGYVCAAGADTEADLVEQAYPACRLAKSTSRGRIVAYARELATDVARSQRLEAGLRQAVNDNELRLYFQPTIDLRDGRVQALEALVRWQHPTDGLLLPAEFLPFAESAGLMNLIGDWVLDQALQIAGRWRAQSDGVIPRLWINLATQQFKPAASSPRESKAPCDPG